MAANETGKKRSGPWACPNRKDKYKLWDLVALLKSDKSFAQFFTTQLKKALNNETAAINCVDSYLEPTTQELQDLGIPPSRIGPTRRCTDSGLLFLVIAKDNARKALP